MVAQQKTKDSSPDSGTAEGVTKPSTNGNPGSPKSRLAMLKRSSARAKTNGAASDPFRFQGSGIDFKGKFIGERDVNEARGDSICAEAMQLAKASVKSAGSHKQRITLNISIEGLKIKDQKTGTIIYNFPVSKISFIARDTTDARAFGFIFGMSNSKYKFYGIKTAQTADHAVLSIRDMFQVVFEMKKKQIQEVKQKQEEQQNAENLQRESSTNKEGVPTDCRMDGGVAVADLLDLETELECIEQGFNQLQNVPHMPEDDYNFEAQWNNSNGNNDMFNTNSNGLVSSTNGCVTNMNRDPFDISFVNSVTAPYMSAVASLSIRPSPFEPNTSHFATGNDIMTSNGFVSNDAANNGFASTPCAVGGFSSAPANFNSTPTAVNAFATTANSFVQAPSTVNGVDAKTAVSGFGTPINGSNSTSTFNADGTLANGVANGAFANLPRDPFDDSFFNSTAPFTGFAPTFNNKNEAAWNANENQRVTTLEEAFSKLVNMDQLVPSTNPVNDMSGVRKNPFEHIINPPKMPMNALVTTTSHFH